ncbi:hypothetical protein SAMN02927923_03407 [Microvirga guangxiensis]|uniref:Uncharacterized protein n=1 Tax=Microvirga guangxiensis TaxID=549386 RepID=A0A1G5KKI0_9HYPH|nr:hypothetical protein SAMN02927923_03407 [Microvirga guangxiensis]
MTNVLDLYTRPVADIVMSEWLPEKSFQRQKSDSNAAIQPHNSNALWRTHT